MKHPKDHRFISSKHIALLLLMFLLSIPVTAHATLYDYTYTGNPTSSDGGNSFDGPYITVQFTFDPGSGPGSAIYGIGTPQIIPYTMTSGQYSILVPPLLIGSNTLQDLLSITWDDNGNITSWKIVAALSTPGIPDGQGNPTVDTTEIYTIKDTYFGVGDGVQIWEDTVTLIANDYNAGWAGSWTKTPTAPVPEPTTMLLLGSGLMGIAGFRRKFRKR